MNGFEKELENRILGVIPHSVLVSNDPINDYELLIKKVNDNKEIIDAAPYISIQGLISSSYDSKGVSVIGIDSDYEKNMSIIPDYMILGSLENLNEKNSIVIGSLLAANLGVYAGDEINIRVYQETNNSSSIALRHGTRNSVFSAFKIIE